MKITTDISGLERLTPSGVQVHFVNPAVGSHPVRLLRLAIHALSSDWLILHFSVPEILFLSVVLFVWPFHRCKMVTLDFFAVAPSPSLLPLIRWAMKRIHTLLVYFKDNQRFQELYGIPAERFRYIPFKVNSWELVQEAQPADEGFVFVGGRSRRDFATLFDAVAGLDIPVKVLTAHEPELLPHGSSLAGLAVPANVEILYRDSDSRFFVDLLRRARLVVLPIRADSRIQAGIGVYIMAMALAKCVVISRCLGVDDVLPPGHAVFVEPGNTQQLRETIVRFWSSGEDRQQIAVRAKAYAFALGGEDSLRRSILESVGLL
jgi:glycosyltransferase involved in cell wall biosynthesis